MRNAVRFLVVFFIFLTVVCTSTLFARQEGSSFSDSQLPGKPSFSIQPGFYTSEIELEITYSDPDVTLYYTTNGSVPSENSRIYRGPIRLSDLSSRPNTISSIPTNIDYNWSEPNGPVKKANVIRVRAFKPGQGYSETTTGTWFIDPAGNDRYSLRIVSLVTDSTHFFSHKTGIYVPGDYYDPGTNPWQQIGNFSQRGVEWERPANIEIFDESGTPFLSQNIGVRIHGGITRSYPQKSLRLYSRSDYGESRFNAKIFPDLEDDRFNRLLLRNSGNDWRLTLFRDAAAQSLVRHFNVDTQAYHPSIVFINGEYWGIHNFRERFDRHYLERVYQIDPDNIDRLTVKDQAEEGNNFHYNQMIDFLESNDLSDDSLFARAETMMDMENFLDYYSAQIYYANNDWPHNNIDFWRLRTPYTPNAPAGHDGRWRWLLYDADRSLGLENDYTFNMIEHVTGTGFGGQSWPNTILNNLLENKNFKHRFINRIADHLNTAFLPERVFHVIDSLKTRIEPEIEEHISRWNHPLTMAEWQQEVNLMKETAAHRPEFVRKHLKEYFDIESDVDLSVEINHSEQGTVYVNSIAINSATPGIENHLVPWTGVYFSGIPITLKAAPEPGYRFSHWSGDLALAKETGDNSLEVTITSEKTANIKAHFRKEAPGETNEHDLMHYWVFTNDLPNDTPLEFIEPVFSAIDGAELEYRPVISPYPPESGTEGIMDRVNDPTAINYRPEGNHQIEFEESGMRGIRARNPSLIDDDESSVILHLPTTGYEDVALSFPAVRTKNGQRELIVEYSTDPMGETWLRDGLEQSAARMFEVWHLNTFSFENIETADDNPYFKIRFRFGGDENIRRGENGNVRFNNILAEGTPIKNHSEETSGKIILFQNRPNPFVATTYIFYELLEHSDVNITVYDILGKQVASLTDGVQPKGKHVVKFDASSLASGVYIYKIQAGSEFAVKKMTFIK